MTGATGRPTLGELRVASRLAADPESVWSHAVTPAGVNRELSPLLRMTFPKGVEELTAGWRPGERAFRSWLLLGGVLPVEYDDVCFVEIEPGRRFLERSSLFSQRVWEHERTVEPAASGCVVTDRVRFEPRLAWLGPLFAPVFRLTFRLRHRNLRRIFRGGPA